MKNILKTSIIIVLLGFYIYVFSLDSVPNNIILFEGEELDLKNILGINYDYYQNGEVAQTASNLSTAKVNTKSQYHDKVSLNLFGSIPVKTVNVDIIPKTKVVPIGSTIGMKLYTNGVMVVGMSEIYSRDIKNTKQNKANKNNESDGISEGDAIIAINDKEIKNTNELIDEINQSGGKELRIKYRKNNEIYETIINPTKVEDNYKIGLWVRDAAAGVRNINFL